MNTEIKLRDHQKNAIARTLMVEIRSLPMWWELVKLMKMVASAMESKRLGLASKSLFAVPNHLTTQITVSLCNFILLPTLWLQIRKTFSQRIEKGLLVVLQQGNMMP